MPLSVSRDGANGLTLYPAAENSSEFSAMDLGNRWLCNKDCTFAVFLF